MREKKKTPLGDMTQMYVSVARSNTVHRMLSGDAARRGATDAVTENANRLPELRSCPLNI